MLKVLSLSFISLSLLGASYSATAQDNDVFVTSSFANTPFVEPLVKQIIAKSSHYEIGKISFSRVGQVSDSLPNIYYIGSDGISSLLVKDAGPDFSALLNYKGRSYKLTATTVTLLGDEFSKTEAQETDSIDEHPNAIATFSNSQNSTSAFYESYQMSQNLGSKSTQSIQDTPAFYQHFDNNALKKVRVVVSENAIIEELENYGEFNFTSLHQRIQSGIDFANLALVTSGVEALQIQASEIVVQRLPKDYVGSVIEEDTYKRIAFPSWGESDATFQMTALALTQNHADIIYNLGARNLFRDSTCGFATVGVNGTKSETLSYSTDHTYPIAITVKRGCETGRTPVHEFGHTIGLNHERNNKAGTYVAGESVPYTHNFGFTSLEESAYSIMSYGLACQDAYPQIACKRANFFSSPDMTYGNSAFGIAKPDPEAADAVRFLNDAWALRFSNTINPMTIRPEPSGGFTITWEAKDIQPESQVLVLSVSSHSRYNYVLDNNAVFNHEKFEIPLMATQTSYTFSYQQMQELGLENSLYDTVSLFTGHINKYDDIIPNLHAQLHAGKSLFSVADEAQSALLMINGKNVKAPQAGDTVTFTFDASGINNFSIDDLKLMTILDSQYNSRFTTAVSKREYNPTNPMLDFVDYELVSVAENKVELRLSLSSDYRDYVGYLSNRETSNYKLPIVGFYLDYSSNQNGVYQQTKGQEVGLDLRNALNVFPFIQAESFAHVIDNDRVIPLSVVFSSTQEIMPSDVNAIVEASSSYEIGNVITTWKQLANKDGKFQYAVTLENPDAIDDEGDAYASVSFGLKSVNLFSTSMVIASDKLMFENDSTSTVKVSSQRETPLSFTLNNLPQGDYDILLSLSTNDATDTQTPIAAALSRVNEEQGVLSFMFDPDLLSKPEQVRLTISLEEGESAQSASHWLDIQYNNIPRIYAEQTKFSAKPGDTVNIPFPTVDDPDDADLEVSWAKTDDAPSFGATNTALQIAIGDNTQSNTSYQYMFEVSDGIDTTQQTFVVDVDASPQSSSTSTSSTTTSTASSATSTQTPASSEPSGGGSFGLLSVSLLLPISWCRRRLGGEKHAKQ